MVSLQKNCCSWSSSQPYAMQITSSMSENFGIFMNSFSLGKREVTWSQDNASDHRSAQALAAIQNYSVIHRIRHLCSYCTANGWLEDQEQQFFYNGIRALRNAGPSEFQLQVSMLKSNKI